VVIKLVSIQVPLFWEVIKFALGSVEKIGVDDSETLYNEVLASLLNDRSQCFVKYGEGEKIIGILISEIHENFVTKKRALRIRCLYSFTSGITFEEDFILVRRFAKTQKCEEVFFETANRKLVVVTKGMGFTEKHTTLSMNLEG